MSEFGRAAGGGRRAAPRAPAPLSAIVTTLARTQSAIVVDVSSTGVRLTGDDLPGLGEEFIINIDGVLTFGTVVRLAGDDRGVAFEAPLDGNDEVRLREQVTQMRGIRPEIKAALDDWMLGVAR